MRVCGCGLHVHIGCAVTSCCRNSHRHAMYTSSFSADIGGNLPNKFRSYAIGCAYVWDIPRVFIVKTDDAWGVKEDGVLHLYMGTRYVYFFSKKYTVFVYSPCDLLTHKINVIYRSFEKPLSVACVVHVWYFWWVWDAPSVLKQSHRLIQLFDFGLAEIANPPSSSLRYGGVNLIFGCGGFLHKIPVLGGIRQNFWGIAPRSNPSLGAESTAYLCDATSFHLKSQFVLAWQHGVYLVGTIARGTCGARGQSSQPRRRASCFKGRTGSRERYAYLEKRRLQSRSVTLQSLLLDKDWLGEFWEFILW